MTDKGETRPVVILSNCDKIRGRIADGLSATLMPVAYNLTQTPCALLITDAPDLSESVVRKAINSATVGNTPKCAPVVFLNDDATNNERESAFHAGAADVLPRNVELDLLVARAMRLITTHATHIEALNLSHSALLGPSPHAIRPIARVFHLRPTGIPALPSCTSWRVAEFQDPETLLAETSAQSWPEVIALPGKDAERLLPGLLSRRGALNTQFLAVETPDEACAQCLALGAADAIPTEVQSGEIAARISTLAAETQDIDRALTHLRAGLDMSYSDALTGLRNRRFFDQKFRGLFQRARLLDQALSVLVFDIDGFKHINDQHGHAAGDTILKEFATRLSGNVRAQDLVTRYGGEEFVVAMPLAAISVALGAAERVRAAIAAPNFVIADNVLASVTVSVGVATLSPNDGQAEDFLARADAALFQAKGLGRNRVAQAA